MLSLKALHWTRPDLPVLLRESAPSAMPFFCNLVCKTDAKIKSKPRSRGERQKRSTCVPCYAAFAAEADIWPQTSARNNRHAGIERKGRMGCRSGKLFRPRMYTNTGMLLTVDGMGYKYRTCCVTWPLDLLPNTNASGRSLTISHSLKYPSWREARVMNRCFDVWYLFAVSWWSFMPNRKKVTNRSSNILEHVTLFLIQSQYYKWYAVMLWATWSHVIIVPKVVRRCDRFKLLMTMIKRRLLQDT